ncbi:MAG: signal peptidase I [Christensenellales bacterium]|jgi:signal peptidase I
MAINKNFKAFIQFIIAVIVAIVAVNLIQQLLFTPVGVIGTSMEPTINSSGDTAYVMKRGYELNVNDIVVFYRPKNAAAEEKLNPARTKFSAREFFVNFLHLRNSISTETESTDNDFICVIKRIVGVPGDTIEIKDAQLYRNGEIVEDFPMKEKSFGIGVNDVSPVEIDNGEYFVLGDNRNISHDSEDYGCIKEDWILGKVVMLISRGENFGIKFP